MNKMKCKMCGKSANECHISICDKIFCSMDCKNVWINSDKVDMKKRYLFYAWMLALFCFGFFLLVASGVSQ